MNFIRNPKFRFYGAVTLFFITIIMGIYSTVFISRNPFERVLMAISWGAITITSVDIMATTDVRKSQDDS